MDFDLVVITPFGGYQRGDFITDPLAIAAALQGNPDHVVQIFQDAGEPTPKAPPTDTPNS